MHLSRLVGENLGGVGAIIEVLITSGREAGHEDSAIIRDQRAGRILERLAVGVDDDFPGADGLRAPEVRGGGDACSGGGDVGERELDPVANEIGGDAGGKGVSEAGAFEDDGG